MTERVLLVDLENVQKIDLAQVPGDARVMIFYGVTQKKLPEELVVQAQPLGVRLKWIKISGQGPAVNAKFLWDFRPQAAVDLYR